MEEQNTFDYMNDNIEQGVKMKEKKKPSFLAGFLCGIGSILLIVVMLSLGATVLFRAGGYVITSFKLDEELTADVLSEPVQNKVAEVLSALSAYYYDELDEQKMAEGMYLGMVNALGDPYTTYYTVEEFAEYRASASGTYYGIGAVLSQDVNTGVITIIRVYKGSPAEEAGLKGGDIFISAAGVLAEGMDVSEFVSLIKGDLGTTVEVVVDRNGTELTFTVERRKVEVPTVEAQMLEDGTAYIQILEFDEITTKQFDDALLAMRQQGMTSLVIDLRDNPGGRLDVVVDILDRILPDGMLVYTVNKYDQKVEYKSDDGKELNIPLVVLVNENSASASEIFAGAIKDYEYGTILGTTTFGKGIVQVILPLSDGSAVKITTSKYYTPNGNDIHGIGIEPDVELEYEYLGSDTEDYDIMKDNQVLKAIELLKD